MGLEALFNLSVLSGDDQSFEVNPSIKSELREWNFVNRTVFAELVREFVLARERRDTWSPEEWTNHITRWQALGRLVRW